jgi:Uma2 family endonuclease
MDAKTAVTAEEYLRTSFPGVDREYRDGELVERGMPDYQHGRTQFVMATFFGGLTKRLPLFPCIETRMKVRDGLYQIPDLAVFHASPPEA